MHVGIVTISDSVAAGRREDRSGDLLQERVQSELGGEVAARVVVADEMEAIADILAQLADRRDLDLILTTGGTGLGPRDVTPEATLQIVHREVPGLPEAMRRETVETSRYSVLSRATAGIRHTTLIINLPGSPNGVAECFDAVADILPHAVEILQGSGHHPGDAVG